MSQRDSDPTRRFDVSGPIAATIRVGGGELIVLTDEAPKAQVTVAAYDDTESSRQAAANTKIEMTDGKLTVEVPDAHGGWLFRRGGRVRVNLVVPAESTLKVQVGSADVRADGRLGELTVQSGSGDTIVTGISGTLRVSSGSGDLRAERVGGALRFNSGSGDITVARVRGDVHLNTASGDVNLGDVAEGARVTTASGDVRLQAVRGGQVRVNTASGDVTVGVPAGTKVWLDLGTMSGSTSSDLSVGTAAPEGGAQLNLQVHTMSGDIQVRRVTDPGPL